MLPYITLFGQRVYINLVLYGLVMAITLISLRRSPRLKMIPIRTHAGAIFFCLLTATFGAKLAHVLFELHAPLNLDLLHLVWVSQGRVFYGSLAGLITGAYFYFNLFCPKPLRLEHWNLFTINGALGYGLLRLGCFANGCCWGKMTSLPWAVTYYHPDSVMPFQGVPVHPVQLYDSLLGFSLYWLLRFLHRKQILESTNDPSKPQKSLLPIFLLLFSMGRFFTEMFRGDPIRGANILLGFSTSQVISIYLFFGVLIYLVLTYSRPPESLNPKVKQ